MKASKKKFLCAALILIACNNMAQANPEQNKTESASTATSKPEHTILTKAQIENFFPKQLGDYVLFNIDVSLLKSKETASATYIKNNDFNHTMVYTLEDGMRKKSATLKNFESSYNTDLKGPESTEYIKMERDVYKTIAFLQPKINRNTISFIYSNHFKLSLEGVEKPDVLWQYFRKEDLEKLNNY